MPRKSKKPVRKQTHSPTGKVVGQVGQILLPMIAGIAATKADLTEWVYEQGLTALHLLLREDAEKIAGPKGKHEKERTHNHWGSTDGELSFGGRRIQVSRPRVRSKSGEEASLPGLGAQLAISVHNCPVLTDSRFPMSIFKRTQRKYVKKAYRVRNWREYEAGLRNRGSLTVWISLTAGKLVNWDAPRPRRRKPGRQRKYSNHAIETAVTLGMVFHLSSRQSEGLLRSLFALMKLDNDVPDHTTIRGARRSWVRSPSTKTSRRRRCTS